MLGVVGRKSLLERGGGARRARIWTRAMMMPAFKTPRLSLNLLKDLYSYCVCSPKSGIMLFINQRGYIHLKPPVVICTVLVVVVNIAAR